jgi:hypothetical protein
MSKPHIKIWRNFRGEAMWQCIGCGNGKRHPLIGRGATAREAFFDWQDACEFPF